MWHNLIGRTCDLVYKGLFSVLPNRTIKWLNCKAEINYHSKKFKNLFIRHLCSNNIMQLYSYACIFFFLSKLCLYEQISNLLMFTSLRVARKGYDTSE